MKRLAILSFIIGLLSVPIQAQAQQSLSMPGCIETLSSSRLASREMLPPGRAKLATIPVSTGSAAIITMGISRVACFAARAHGT
jgi:hypothetical protein